jgi:hypothetical protein
MNLNKSVLDEFNYCFFMGDFNYRIEHSLDYIKSQLSNCEIDNLIEYDQMLREIKSGDLKFNGFNEGKISFPPTYKINPDTGEYIAKEGEKMPGWTDRILYYYLVIIDIKYMLKIKKRK